MFELQRRGIPPGIPSSPTIVRVWLSSPDLAALERATEAVIDLARRMPLAVLRGRGWRRVIYRPTTYVGAGGFIPMSRRFIAEVLSQKREALVLLGGEAAAKRFIELLPTVMQDFPDVSYRYAIRPKITDQWIIIELTSPDIRALTEAVSLLKSEIGRWGLRVSERFYPKVEGEPRRAALRVRFPLGAHGDTLLRLLQEVRARYGVEISVRTIFGPPPKFQLRL